MGTLLCRSEVCAGMAEGCLQEQGTVKCFKSPSRTGTLLLVSCRWVGLGRQGRGGEGRGGEGRGGDGRGGEGRGEEGRGGDSRGGEGRGGEGVAVLAVGLYFKT